MSLPRLVWPAIVFLVVAALVAAVWYYGRSESRLDRGAANEMAAASVVATSA